MSNRVHNFLDFGYSMRMVLFVDDDPQVTELLCTVCRKLDIGCILANSGAQAIEILETQSIDILVTDLKMPRMNGVQLAEIVQERWPAISRYSFTGETRTFPMDDLCCLFEHVYIKPLDYGQLLTEIMKNLAVRQYPFLA